MRTRVICKHCNDSGICRRCEGAGCMDCYYEGVCPHCEDARRERDRDIEMQFVRSRSHGRYYFRRENEYFD